MIDVRHGDCREVIKTLADDSIHAVVTDPPYSLVSIGKRLGNPDSVPIQYGTDGAYARAARGFMGKKWDTGETAFDPAFWAEVYRVLKPGAHLIAFGSTRTYHRLACAIEDAGFEIRDQIGWLYGSGFPKSHDVSKAIDRAAGAEREVVGFNTNWRATKSEIACPQGDDPARTTIPATPSARQWEGWGTALKPAWEPIVLARKPLIGTVAANVLAHGTGAINVDGCRVGTNGGTRAGGEIVNPMTGGFGPGSHGTVEPIDAGRWPANIIHDGSEEVIAAFPETGASSDQPRHNGEFKSVAKGRDLPHTTFGHSDSGSAARFFYTAKADSDDRLGSKHPTVKPVDLMAYLIRLVTPPGGTILDPFAGSGTTGMAAMREGFDCILIEREAEYVADIKARLGHVKGDDLPLFSESWRQYDLPLSRAELDADARGNYELALEELRRR